MSERAAPQLVDGHAAVDSEAEALVAVSDRALVLDAAGIAVVSCAICVASDRTALMTVLVAAVFASRLLLWSRLPEAERGGSLKGELALISICTLLGAFNDHSSVVRHGVYDYTVAVWLPEHSTIPLWMLAFWGLILRFVTSLTRWRRLAPRHRPRATLRLALTTVRSPWAALLAQLALVVVTRQCIYRLYADPLWSWLPFALALIIYAALFELNRRDLALMALFLLGGPMIEILYIQLGGLHRYQLGWLGGVPLWIVLWWVLAVAVWQDVSVRLLRRLERL